MRRRTLLTALPFLCAALACGGPTVRSEARPAALSIGPALRAIPVADTPAWLIVHDARIPATSLLYLTRDGSPILADTPWTPEATRALLAWIRSRFGRPPALATISHFHLDAAGGIAALREAEVPVVASTHTAELLAARGPGMREQVAALLDVSPDDLVLGAPDVTFDEAAGFERTVGGTQVRVIYPGAAHAPDNIVTFFPESGVLFGGCLVKSGDDLGNLGDANSESYPRAVARLQALAPRYVIAGHGERTDPGQLDNTARLLARGAP